MDPVTDAVMAIWGVGALVATFVAQWRITWREETGRLQSSAITDDRIAMLVGAMLWPMVATVIVASSIPAGVFIWGPRWLIRRYYLDVAEREETLRLEAQARRIECEVAGRLGGKTQ